MSPLALQLYKTIQKIPRGKVTTYGTLAKYLKTSPRAIASMLAANTLPDVYPCYKIVHTDGRLGGYSYGEGVPEKIRRLKSDGIEILDGKVDLERFGMGF
ncbi:MAG: MGMT family protein [Candidatus Gracilibacteria bacterium]|nr:MGMT family protein [Candidatus Gracilibacteria bacterium]